MKKMHHLYPTSTGDPLCPLGFHPQVRWPTRCKRCFRDYKDHKDHGGKKTRKDSTASSPNLFIWKQNSARPTKSTDDDGRIWTSTSSLAKNEFNTKNTRKIDNSNTWCSTMDLSSMNLSDLQSQEPEVIVTVNEPRPKTYAGSQSDSYNFQRFSIDESLIERHNVMLSEPRSKHKLQIKSVIDKSNETSSVSDAEYIIQVRKSQIIDQNGTNTESTEKEMRGGKTQNQEIEKLKTELSDMRARCERVEKEKAEILLHRLATIDSTSSKSSGSDVLKLQKIVKDLQTKNNTLTEERINFVAKIKSLEKESNLKTHKNERERATEELRSKLKATETLCENLMDENEGMKKEIRELEEEIYEMQDNFREEQADEYTTIRKNLEQSNKNCRILSFKLRKIERKAEQLEADKTDLEKKYEQIKKIEDILKQVGAEYKNRSLKKPKEFVHKMQLGKPIDGIEKDIGDVINLIVKIIDERESGISNFNFKYDKLYEEHELLKENLNKILKELTQEKEKKSTIGTDRKNEDLINLKKKLEESQSSHELECKSWNMEKVKLQEEIEKLKSKLLSLSANKLKVYNEVVQLKKDLEVATSSNKETVRIETVLEDLKKELSQERDRSKKLQDYLSSLTDKEFKLNRSLVTAESTKIQLESDLKQTKLQLENAKNSTSAKIVDMTTESLTLKKEIEKLKTQLDKEKYSKDTEIVLLKRKNYILEKVGLNSKKMQDLKQSYDDKIANLECKVKRGVQQYNELNNKQEELSESNLQLNKENQLLNGQLLDHKQDYITLQAELQEVRQFYKAKETEWSVQICQLEEQLHEYKKTANTLLQTDLQEENLRLKKESSSLTKQIEDLKKSNDDLSGKLQDYTHVAKIQRNFSTDSSVLESELRKAKNTVANVEKARKADLAQCKLRYEQRIVVISDEIKSTLATLTKYKRERDTYKQMLESSQKTIVELKNTKPRKHSITSIGKSDEDEELTIANRNLLEKQINTMEDEMSEAKLEASKLKTELVSEKLASEIKLSEMQSRINELEEERLLASGRLKIPGLKIRMELAWQKERQNQQRLLKETATLARDLRQTLFEVERGRDKERLENKRKQDQLKKIFDEEKDETKKKLVELQCDLLELRDAHAKLRTSNEKMRREKERHEREREDLRGMLASKRRLEQSEVRNLNMLLQQVDDLMRLFPEMNGGYVAQTETLQSPDTYTPTPPRRLKGPKSRESSPMLDSKDENKLNLDMPTGKNEKLEYTIKKLMEVAKELQDSKKTANESINRPKKMEKRSLSIDNDTEKSSSLTRLKSTLKRKSLSLEQTTGRNEQAVWGNNSNVSSILSLEGSDVDSLHYRLQRDSSVESYLSNESTKSEILRHEKKNCKGIIRRITTKLTKSASVEDPNSSFESSIQTSASETSIIESLQKDKKNLKKKLSNVFKRGSKSNGLNKKLDLKNNSKSSSRISATSTKL